MSEAEGDAGEVLGLLLAGATGARWDAALAAMPPAHRDLAQRVREQMELQRSREAELSALYETARDLTAIRDLDTILGAIVRRARQLLGADMTYLSLNDEADGASYMKVTDGALTAEFRRLRLPLGTGLLGLVAQAGAPYFTEDYQSDERFVHRGYIDDAVAGEQIRAILGVPLVVEGVVIGALLAVHRRVRPFPAAEVTLLTSFAAHAAVALENARLFDRARAAVADADAASAALRLRTEATERAAHAHDLLTDVLLRRGGLDAVAAVLAEVLGGEVAVLDDAGAPLVGTAPTDLGDAVAAARASGRCVHAGEAWVAVAAAGEEHLCTLVLRGSGPLEQPERRTLERGALVAATVLLFARSTAEAESQVRGELLIDLLDEVGDPDVRRRRALARGVDLDADLVVAVTKVPDPARAVRRVAAAARSRGGLVAVHDAMVVWLAPGDDAHGLGAELQRVLGPDATVGVAGHGRRDPVRLHHDARQTHDALVALGRRGEVADPTRLGLSRLLLGSTGPADLEDFVAGTLGPVLAYDAEHGTALVDTMEAWFRAGGSPRLAGDLLHVHANTVSQRVERAQRVLGHDWRDPRRALDVQLALQVLRLRG